MPDISTFWARTRRAGTGRLAGAGPGRQGDDLETAVLISLFTDRRADPDDVIPDGTGDPRGWWGDTGRDRRSAPSSGCWSGPSRPRRPGCAAEDYIDDALAWLVEDGIAASSRSTAAWQRRRAGLGRHGHHHRAGGRQRVFNYQWAWKAVN
jgi:phage gp46-like protein